MDNTKDYPPFSVAISTYKNDNSEWLDIALESIILKQTLKPSEIVLVIDGPVSDKTLKVVEKYKTCCADMLRFKVIFFPENKGLGMALKTAIENSSYELVARMDSDDISVNNRFELQMEKFSQSDIDICGGQIEEFIGEPSNTIGKRIVPETDQELKKYLKKRCPFNHMTVMYKKNAVIEAGNYQDWFWNEDYYLWIRMALKNQRFANLTETLVKVRVGKDMYARRGGSKYFKSEIDIQKLMLEKKIINKSTFICNCAKRFVVQILLPNSIRAWAFKKFARE